jgi:hypothetical protein
MGNGFSSEPFIENSCSFKHSFKEKKITSQDEKNTFFLKIN